MKRKIIVFAILFSVVMVLPVYAQTANALSLSKILDSIKSKIEVLKSDITSLKEAQYKEKLNQTFQRPLYEGISGNDVTLLQEILSKYSDVYPQGLATGYFGPLTAQAVDSFKKLVGIQSSTTILQPDVLTRVDTLVSVSNQFKKLNSDLVDLNKKYAQTQSGAKKNEVLSKLKIKAEERKKFIRTSLKDNPEVIGKYIFSQKIIKNFPAEILPLLEQESLVEGKLKVQIADNFEKKTSKAYYFIQSNNLLEQLIFTKRPNIEPNSDIKIKGSKIDNIIFVTDDVDLELVGNPPPEINAIGTKRVAVIFSKFVDDPYNTSPFDITNYQTKLFSAVPPSADTFMNEVSFGRLRLQQGNFYGPYRLSISANGGCEQNNWKDWIDDAASADGFNEANYDLILYAIHGGYTNGPDCGWDGAAIKGGKISWYLQYGEASPAMGVFVHEFGHNFGNDHSNTYDCYENGNRVSISNNCSSFEYGDEFDDMGFFNAMGYFPPHHYNSVWKSKIGWIDSDNVQTVTTSGTYTIRPLEFSTADVQAIKIPRSDNHGNVLGYYWLEFRQPTYYDDFVQHFGQYRLQVINGVSIRYVDNPISVYKTNLIDTTPLTNENPNGVFRYFDAPLTVGNVFSDNDSRISVKTLSADSSGATVDIDYGSHRCLESYPGISVVPMSQVGSPGQALTYTVTIINNDTSRCRSDDFTIAPSSLSGLSQTPNIIDVTLQPGEMRSFDIAVTLDSTVTVDDILFKEGITRARTIQTIETPWIHYLNCIRRLTDFSIFPIQNYINAPGGILSYDFSLKNNDSVNCPGNQYEFRADLPPGYLQQIQPAGPFSFSISPGISYDGNLILSSTPAAMPGYSYPFNVILDNLNYPEFSKTVTGIFSIRTSTIKIPPISGD